MKKAPLRPAGACDFFSEVEISRQKLQMGLTLKSHTNGLFVVSFVLFARTEGVFQAVLLLPRARGVQSLLNSTKLPEEE